MFFENLPAEQIYGVYGPKQEEYRESNTGVGERLSGKPQQEQKRSNHDHCREGGKNVQAGGGGNQIRINFLHQDHAVGSGSCQGAEAHQEELVFKAFETLFGNQTDVDISDDAAYYTEDHNGKNVVFDVVDLDGGNTCHNHQVEGETGDPVHLVAVDIASAHHLALFQMFDHKLDKHGRQGGPQKIKTPCNAVGKIGNGG